MVYQRAPAVVRERADKVVALVKPSLCAAAKTEEAKKLRDSGSEAYTAFIACVTAIWSFFGPVIAALIYDVAMFIRDRRKKAGNVETYIIMLVDGAYQIIEKAVISAGRYIESYGRYPKLVVEYVEIGCKWIMKKAEVLENTEVDGDEKVVYKNAKEVVAAPRASLCAAMESTEGQRFRKAAYAVVLASVACIAALMGALIPVLAGGVAWAVAAFWERQGTATSYDSWIYTAFHTFWGLIEKGTSSGVQIAESYDGPCNLALLQIATALKMLVEWLKEAAGKHGVEEAEKVTAPSFEERVVVKAEEILEKAEVVVGKVESVVDEVETAAEEKTAEVEKVAEETGTAANEVKTAVVEKAEAVMDQ